jgi:hypothetical protein
MEARGRRERERNKGSRGKRGMREGSRWRKGEGKDERGKQMDAGRKEG